MYILGKLWFVGALAGLLGGAAAGVALLSLTAGGNAPDVIRALAQLLWPVVTVIVALCFREELRGLLARLRKGKFPGGEFELDAGTERPPPERDRQRTAMEYKILKTLWTKQVNRFPKYDGVWTFRLNASAPEFLEFREAASRLMGEGLVGETDQGQLFLTLKGFDYAKQNHAQFPEDEWWPEEKLNPEKLKEALGQA
jgi:hypothetical protein